LNHNAVSPNVPTNPECVVRPASDGKAIGRTPTEMSISDSKKPRPKAGA
jgi:hypothetical protein